ncbi:MAG: hypothetical protein EOR68_15055 [Mesorhizobium sp.]|uniref:Abi family protein n=1 Tax=Mesorhizobium sp. TaxID=1871066 RepID=UPI000FE7AF4D|nr:Abi family protein [Mesorhizobium sp.]RWL98398.1 MAG: hypothetical protein EOR68_15055 [Mesorhizobium sp.]
MAESQHAFDYGSAEVGIRRALTEPRLGKYLKQGGFEFPYTMQWYLWNARLAKAFQFPLHALEVTLRNAVHEHIVLTGGPEDWPFDTTWISAQEAVGSGIREALNRSKRQLLKRKMTDREYTASVEEVSHLDVPAFGKLNRHDVLANMSLEFWVRLLDYPYERAWQLSLRRVFPNADLSDTRRHLCNIVRRIKDFRNRVAHHEPIFHRTDLQELHADMIKVIGMRCGLTKSWVQHHSTFHAIHSDRPSRDGLSALDSVPSIVRAVVRVADPAARLKELLPELAAAEASWAVVEVDGGLSAVGSDDILKWLATGSQIGIADLEQTIAKVIANAASAHRVEPVSPDITLSEAGAKFFARNVPSKKKPTLLVLTSDGTPAGQPLGVLLKNDVRIRTRPA